MPVEIRELIIRTVVEPRGGVSSLADSRPEQPAPPPLEDAADLVQACVREVLRILAAQKER